MPKKAPTFGMGSEISKGGPYGAGSNSFATVNTQPQNKTTNNFMPRSVATALDDDLDDLDSMMDNMGIEKKNELNDFFNNDKKKKVNKNEGQMRDTLGFLKRADDEKKQKAEAKLLKDQEAEAAYKTLDQMSYKLDGHQPMYGTYSQ